MKDLNKIFESTQESENWQWTTELETGEFLASLIKMTGAKHVVEIGVFKGFSSVQMIEALPKDGTYVGIDIEDLIIEELAHIKKDKRVKFMFENSLDALPKLDKADLVFIDGLHEFDHNVKEFKLIEKFISKGGIVAVHDSEHIPDVLKFVNWLRNFPHFDIINLPTNDVYYHGYSRGLALIRCKNGK